MAWERAGAWNSVKYMAGQIRLKDGSASIPSLSFDNDVDSGLYRIGANNVGLSLGGVLEYDFSAVALNLKDNIIYGSSAANGDITIEGTSHATKTTSYVILQPTEGNVGIGTTTPAYKLNVAGDANITGTYRVNGSPISATSNWTLTGDNIYYATGNVGIGATSFGASAAKVLGIFQGTAPTTSPVDTAQLWVADYNGAVTSRLYMRDEEGNSGPVAFLSETEPFYGITWDESTDTYTRTGRTAGHKTGGTLPAAMLPIQRRMRRCLLTDAGAVNYYLSPTDSTKKEDGSTASDLTGTDGQVMVEIPKFWYRYGYAGTIHTYEVSPVPLAGFNVHPAFIKNSVEVPYRYIGAYEGILYDNSASLYVDGIYQTAVSCVFALSDSSLTIASRSGVFTNLTVGQKIVVTGTTDNNGTKTIASLVSATKITISEACVDETAASTVISTERDYTATTGDKLSSVNAKAAISYLTRANARVIASNRGAGWRSWDFDLAVAIQLLYLVEYASFYSQSMIGAGITNVIDWPTYNNYNPIARSGNSNAIGNATGNTAGATSALTESTKYLSYRGIENWFGHLWKWVDGFNINNNIPYVTNNAANWADNTTTNYILLVNVLGANITLHNVDGYPATIQKTGRGFLAASVGGSSTTKLTDYYYQASGWQVACFGGYTSSGVTAGGFFWNLNYASSYLGQYFGTRLGY